MAASDAPEKNIAWLAEQIESKLGQDVPATKLRVILRKLVNDGEIERGEGRWSFTGLKDPAVVAVIKAVKEGAAEDKPKPAAKKAAAKKAAPARKGRKAKAAPEPEVDEDDEDVLDEDELDLE
ncbi:hypothetical protein PP996_gp38 [Gordonia phage SheckWes]|uniref:Uncharacterized protein n=1 Tax=Gordonia phage SheckWes TaxID=2591117 RepID=A0A515MIN2_9CAUD|nr:hypothetical protein PP996_gp38 [Gordonia phage SheckWes]QDM56464.1 hypothetical protein SEA_SHECKWES_38 [Gordonia phage SheckWes]